MVKHNICEMSNIVSLKRTKCEIHGLPLLLTLIITGTKPWPRTHAYSQSEGVDELTLSNYFKCQRYRPIKA